MWLADQVILAADFAIQFKQQSAELKSKTQILAYLLRLLAHARQHYFARRIISYTEQVLDEALALLLKCSANVLKRVFKVIPSAAFAKMSSQLQSSIVDVSWLLKISAGSEGHLGLPPFATNDPIICLIWEQIAILSMGSIKERSNASGLLVTLFRENDRFGKLFIEDGGVSPLSKLMKVGELQGRENAARAIGLLANDPENVKKMIQTAVCSVIVEILRRGPMKVQALVAWAVSEFSAHYPKCQNLFARLGIIPLLIDHLAFRSKYDDAVNVAANDIEITENDEDVENESDISSPLRTSQSKLESDVVEGTMALNGNISLIENNLDNSNDSDVAKVNPVHFMLSGAGDRTQEVEDPVIEAYTKTMVLRAIRYLAKGNRRICRSISKSRTLWIFAVLLENGPEEVRLNLAMALLEITTVAEGDAELKSAFNPNLPACKAVFNQLVTVINKAESALLIPCIKTIGNLAQNFRAEGTKLISSLLNLLDKGEAEVDNEICTTLTKFICPENHLHQHYSKLIISAGGVQHLVQLVYFGEKIVKQRALTVLCHIALHVPGSQDIAQVNLLAVLKWTESELWPMQDESVCTLLEEAKKQLFYHTRHHS
ncbi:Armadillo repeat only 2 [Dorcoceras hygrometricum]|uniref:Armadillo repeat only 2 n=1 Tax=Dorcoceras hygrometricum TaxID=472368 RepID=A0A2Z7AT03_9LAMI|nr:Armadillo repeat only 2 [Dorcoceras hygrometricum]